MSDRASKIGAWAQHAALNAGQLIGGHGSAVENVLYGLLPPSWSGHSEEDIKDLDRSSSLTHWFNYGRHQHAPHPAKLAMTAGSMSAAYSAGAHQASKDLGTSIAQVGWKEQPRTPSRLLRRATEPKMGEPSHKP